MKRFAAIILLIAFCVFLFPFKVTANADGGLSALAAASYAFAQSCGFTFSLTGAGFSGSSMEGFINSYAQSSGLSLIELFGPDPVLQYGTGLLLTKAAADGIKSFINWLTGATDGSYIYDGFDNQLSGQTNLLLYPYEYNALGVDRRTEGKYTRDYCIYSVTNRGTGVVNHVESGGYSIANWSVISNNGITFETDGQSLKVYGDGLAQASSGYSQNIHVYLGSHSLSNIAMFSLDDTAYNPLDVPSGKEWVGDISGSTSSSLDDIADFIFDSVNDGTLSVEGNVIDDPEPKPTPVPTYPPAETILDGVNTVIEQGNDTISAITDVGLDIGGMKQGIEDLNDLTLEQKQILEDMGIDIGGMKQGIEDLNDLTLEQEQILEGMGIDIGGMAEGLDDLNDLIIEQNQKIDVIEDDVSAIPDAIQSQTGSISGAIDQAVSDVGQMIGSQSGSINQAISNNAGVVSGAIDQAVSDVQTAIGEQTAALEESLTATAEGVETIAEAIEDETINWTKFDLRGLFPFCIPFDIYNMLNALDATPIAPHVRIPFVIQSLGFSYSIDLDFSDFDPVAAIMRQMELICYGLALAWATSKVIKW